MKLNLSKIEIDIVLILPERGNDVSIAIGSAFSKSSVSKFQEIRAFNG